MPLFKLPGIGIARVVAVALFATTAADAIGQAPETGSQRRTVWDGTYTELQAQRGAKHYAEVCAMCHGEDMSGAPGIPALMGPEFLFGWDGKAAADVFTIVQTMPPGEPGKLTEQEYADVLAAIFEKNGFPAGEMELSPKREALEGLLITRKKP